MPYMETSNTIPKYKKNSHNIKGFTLVEISIVLVVIGLITVTITAGIGFIHAAKLQSVITDINSYKTATNLFKDKYDAYPGDMPDAWDYWGTDCNSSANTCNGNGDNKIGPQKSDMESKTFWTHLSLAKMIPGSYVVMNPNDTLLGVNMPESALDGIGFQTQYGCWAGAWPCFGRFGNVISPSANNGGVITPAEALSIDKKIDDGHADSGHVRPAATSDQITAPSCIGTTNPIFVKSGSYDLSSEEKSCRLAFFID